MDEICGEKFIFGSFKEAQSVRDEVDYIINITGHIPVRTFLELVTGMEVEWIGEKDLLDNFGWLDILGWKIRQNTYHWVLQTTKPVRIFKGESHD